MITLRLREIKKKSKKPLMSCMRIRLSGQNSGQTRSYRRTDKTLSPKYQRETENSIPVPLFNNKFYTQKTDELIIFFFVFFKLCVFSAETLNSTGGVDQFLFSGKKRMAVGTNFHTDVLDGCADFKTVSTCTSCCRCVIFWMNTFFHFIFNSLKDNYEFIEFKNSALFFVPVILSSKKLILSTGFNEDNNFLRIQILSRFS